MAYLISSVSVIKVEASRRETLTKVEDMGEQVMALKVL